MSALVQQVQPTWLAGIFLPLRGEFSGGVCAMKWPNRLDIRQPPRAAPDHKAELDEFGRQDAEQLLTLDLFKLRQIVSRRLHERRHSANTAFPSTY